MMDRVDIEAQLYQEDTGGIDWFYSVKTLEEQKRID